MDGQIYLPLADGDSLTRLALPLPFFIVINFLDYFFRIGVY